MIHAPKNEVFRGGRGGEGGGGGGAVQAKVKTRGNNTSKNLYIKCAWSHANAFFILHLCLVSVIQYVHIPKHMIYQVPRRFV